MLVPAIEKFTEWDSFIDSSSTSTGDPLMLLLEHQVELDDYTLACLFAWNDLEKERISRFRCQSSKTSWCIARVLAYGVLSNILRIPPREVNLLIGKYGKPYLSGNPVYFNWSHCNGCCAFAFSTRDEIGCDIEDSMRSIPDLDEIMQNYFREEEISWIARTSGDTKRRRFLSIFCQKEAWLKKMGYGFSIPLTDVTSLYLDMPFFMNGIACISFGEDSRFIAAVCNNFTSETLPVLRHHQFQWPC